MIRRILMVLLFAFSLSKGFGQTDTIVTRLHEVAVVGVKQSTASELSPVSVVSAQEVERLNIASMKGVSELVPNLYMPEYGSRMTSSIYVRGLGARIDQPVVGLSIDNVPYLNKDSYDFDLFDIDRMEVLRGAQSILNGRNTMAGQINITTLSPWRYQGWRFMAEYGKANTIKSGVGYYAKPMHNLATSANAYFTHTDGFFRNQYNGGRLDRENQGSARWKISWHPYDRLSLTNVASAQISRQGGYPYQSLATGKIAYNDTCFYRRNSFSDGLTVGWTGKRVIVTSVTSVQYIDDNMTLDQDFRVEPYFIMSQKRKEYNITQDLYAKGSRGALSWLGGVFGFYKHTDMSAPVTFKNDGIANLIEKYPNEMNPAYPVQWDTRSFVLGSDFINITKGLAAYGQTSYRRNRLTIELGLRLDAEWATLSYLSHCNTSFTRYHLVGDDKVWYSDNPVVINDKGHLKHSFLQLLPKLAVGYDLGNGATAFANISKGYKAGGYNTQMFSDVLQQKLMEIFGLTNRYDVDQIVSYRPEKSWNFEAGCRYNTQDNKASIATTLFYISCTDQQLTVFPDGLTTGRMMTNAGHTRSFGIEATASWSPTATLLLRGSYGYTNARFVEYFNGKTDFKGKRLPYAPANTAFVSAAYSLPAFADGIIPSVSTDLRGVGDIYWNDDNTVRQPFYATLGLSAALTAQHWTLRLWAENVTNTKYNTFYFVSMSNAFVQRSRPVTFGATLRVNL